MTQVSVATLILEDSERAAARATSHADDFADQEIGPASPLSVFLAVDSPSMGALPPIDVSGGYGFSATRLGPTRNTPNSAAETVTVKSRTLASLQPAAPAATELTERSAAQAGSVLGSMHKQLGLANNRPMVTEGARVAAEEGNDTNSTTSGAKRITLARPLALLSSALFLLVHHGRLA
eukprot:scaffold234757_cov44-Prasinocladus_malaysianus.AAC.5